MSWHAKRTGGYTTDSQEYYDNVWEIYNLLSDNSSSSLLIGDAWRDEAIVGLIANASWESGLNPWRYNSIQAYGLVQFYPHTYYIGGRGVGFAGYAPSTSPSASGDGAQPEDGQAQLLVVDSPTQTKYIANDTRKNKARQLDWAVLEWDSIHAYKMCDDVDEAIQAFLLFYEYPSSNINTLRNEYYTRRGYVDRIYEILGGTPPPPPPPPPPPSRDGKMPLYFYTLKRYRMKKGNIPWQ